MPDNLTTQQKRRRALLLRKPRPEIATYAIRLEDVCAERQGRIHELERENAALGNLRKRDADATDRIESLEAECALLRKRVDADEEELKLARDDAAKARAESARLRIELEQARVEVAVGQQHASAWKAKALELVAKLQGAKAKGWIPATLALATLAIGALIPGMLWASRHGAALEKVAKVGGA